MEGFFQIGLFLVLLVIGFVFGRMAERAHFRRLEQAEARLARILVFNERTPPPEAATMRTELVNGSVVLGEDYFKRVAGSLKSLVGGRLTVYESIMDRGRREAIVRLKHDAAKLGATMVFNVRFETTSLGDPARPQALFSAEFHAYGTALVPERADVPMTDSGEMRLAH